MINVANLTSTARGLSFKDLRRYWFGPIQNRFPAAHNAKTVFAPHRLEILRQGDTIGPAVPEVKQTPAPGTASRSFRFSLIVKGGVHAPRYSTGTRPKPMGPADSLTRAPALQPEPFSFSLFTRATKKPRILFRVRGPRFLWTYVPAPSVHLPSGFACPVVGRAATVKWR